MSIVFGEERHSFLCCDDGTQLLREFDINGDIVWELKTDGYTFDVWQLPDNTILYCYYGGAVTGVKIIDRSGNTLMNYETEKEIFSCQPLADGKVLVGELGGQRLVEVDRSGSVTKIIPLFYDEENKHEIMRAPRKVKDGTYLVAQPGLNMIIRYDGDGKILKKYNIRKDVFGLVEEDNGNILYACIEGLFEIDRDGNEIWSVIPEDVPEMGMKWLLGLQLRKNGNIIVGNWLGHGHNGNGIPIFELTRDKKVVWSCRCQHITSEMSNFHITGEDTTESCYKPLK